MNNKVMNNNETADLPPLALLQLLSDGKNHSGQELADILGVSRTAIWKQLAKLDALGMELISQAGKGYRLVGGLDLLDSRAINEGLVESVSEKISRLSILESIASTNTYLMEQEPGTGIAACFAEYQTAGRGRRGRQWASPFAGNIYLSLRMSSNSGLGVFEGMSLAVGVAVVRALGELGAEDIKLKWPNDILWLGKKLGGILIEVVGDPAGMCHLVVGLGLNLQTKKSMGQAIDQPWVALDSILATPPGRNRVASCLLNYLVPLLDAYEDQGFLHYKPEWESLNAQANQEVDLFMGSNQVSGVMKGVNPSGALLLETKNGLEVFHGGEISLRVAQ